MLLLGDYHTHSVFSKDAHGTIEQNVAVAQQKGLLEIASTEHSFNHSQGTTIKDIATERKIIDEINQTSKTKVLFGLETNLIDRYGTIDLPKDVEEQLDIVLMGYHYSGKCANFKSFLDFKCANSWHRFFGYSKNRIQKNTDSYLRTIDKNNIDIIVHLNYGIPVDAVQIAKLAIQKNVYIELNGKRVFFPQDQLEEMIALKTKFLINSDAHTPDRIGECNLPTNYALINKIPNELIVNFNETPKFKKHR